MFKGKLENKAVMRTDNSKSGRVAAVRKPGKAVKAGKSRATKSGQKRSSKRSL